MKVLSRSQLFTKDFWVDLGVKTVKTAFQASYGVLIAAQTGLLKDVDFQTMAQVAGFTALACVLMNVGNAADTPKDEAPAEVTAKPVVVENPEV